MTQTLLFPDPRPLVERLGREFFRRAPERPGVYLMRDAADTVLYVGKARNLRKRLASYRVANPDRMPRRHLRLLRAVARIQLEESPDELSALAREAELLRSLRPPFNRAGTWPGTPRYLGWRITGESLELTVAEALPPGWHGSGPLGAAAAPLRAAVARVLWCAVHPDRGLARMPEGWFGSRLPEPTPIPLPKTARADFEASEACLRALFAGCADDFAAWIRQRTSTQSHPFELAAREADLETVVEFSPRLTTNAQ